MPLSNRYTRHWMYQDVMDSPSMVVTRTETELIVDFIVTPALNVVPRTAAALDVEPNTKAALPVSFSSGGVSRKYRAYKSGMAGGGG